MDVALIIVPHKQALGQVERDWIAACDALERRIFPKHEALAGSLQRESQNRAQTMVIAVEEPTASPLGYLIVNHRVNRIEKLAVHPDHRRQGVAKRLIAWAIDRVPTAVSLNVDPERSAAVSLYESAGFRIAKHCPDFYREGRHAVLMVRDPSGAP